MRLSISHSTCTAEDPRKIRGRPPRKSWIQKHTGPPASKFWRQATAEDPRKTPRKSFGATGSILSCGACLPALWASGGSTGWRATGWPPGGGPPGGHQSKKNSFACTAEDPRKMRGRSAEDPRGSRIRVTSTGHILFLIRHVETAAVPVSIR